MRIRRLLCLTLAFLAISAQLYVTSAAEDVCVVYCSSTGSDSNNGKTEQTAFQTIEKAYSFLGDAGGTIVICDAVNKGDFLKWSSSVLKKYPHTGMITLTGKDPYTGKLYENAELYHNTIGFFGPTTLEYLAINTHRTYGFINTCGQEIHFGNGLRTGETKIGIYVHDGIGETYGTYDPVPSVTSSVSSGDFQSYFLGGGYPRVRKEGDPITAGVTGDVNFTMNGGSIGSLVIGFDKYQSGNGFLKGNVFITVNGGMLSGIGSNNIEGTIGGAVEIIMNNGVSVQSLGNICTADGGVYIVKASRGGNVSHTEKTGEFLIEAKNGYIPYINGKEAQTGIVKLEKGTSEIEFKNPAAENITVNKYSSYIEGYSDGTFKPENKMTRAEAVSAIVRLIADENEIKGKYKTTFEDCKETEWYYSNIAFLENVDIIRGYEKNFLPDQNITRAEFIELMCNISNDEMLTMYAVNFTDVKSNHPRYDAICKAVSTGLATGYPDGRFLPEGEITRAEVVTLVNRFLKRVPTGNPGINTFTDISGHWAENQIICAANESEQTISEKQVKIWETGTEAKQGKTYEIPEGLNKATDYIKDLVSKKSSLSGDEFVFGVDKIAEKMKSDILNTKSNLSNVTGTVYYVSNNGNDSNDGKSPETAFKTMTKVAWVPMEEGDAVLFERGGEWRGKYAARPGITYSAYGEGPKPIFNGSDKNYADETLWKETGTKNVYLLTDAVTNVGIVAFDHDKNDIGKYDKSVGTMKIKDYTDFNGYSDLKNDLDFYCDLLENKLYLYCDKGNPGSRFESIEIGESTHIMSISVDNVTIDNIHFTFGGAHGIGGGTKSNLTVTNCVFDWIGGSVLKHENGRNIVRFGNAVEIYGGCDGYFVRNNWMYQIYDTGVTHQYSGPSNGDCHMNNVNYTDNLIEYCHWSIEFYNQPHDGTSRTLKNVYMSGNVCRLGGYGWGSIVRMSGATMYCNAGTPADAENLTTEYNILDRCAGNLMNLNGGDKNCNFNNNVYIQSYPGNLGAMFGSRIRFNLDVAEMISTFDKNPIVIFNNSKSY